MQGTDSTDDHLYLRGARSFVQGRFESVAREPFDDGWTPEEQRQARAARPRSRSSARARSSRTTTRPTSASTTRSTRTAAASTAASTATPGRATPTWSSRRAWTSRPSSSPRPTPPSCCARTLAKPGYQPQPDRARRQHRLLPADRAQVQDHAPASSRCWPNASTRSRSSRSRRWSSATSTCSAPMAQKNLVKVFVSIGTLDRELARKLEPRAASPQRRLDVLKALSENKVPCGVMVAAADPGAERQDHGARARSRRGGRRERSRLRDHAAAERAEGRSSRNGSPSTTRSAPSTSSASCARCAAGKRERPALRHAHDRHRQLRRADREALRHRLPALRPEWPRRRASAPSSTAAASGRPRPAGQMSLF